MRRICKGLLLPPSHFFHISKVTKHFPWPPFFNDGGAYIIKKLCVFGNLNRRIHIFSLPLLPACTHTHTHTHIPHTHAYTHTHTQPAHTHTYTHPTHGHIHNMHTPPPPHMSFPSAWPSPFPACTDVCVIWPHQIVELSCSLREGEKLRFLNDYIFVLDTDIFPRKGSVFDDGPQIQNRLLIVSVH